MNLAGHDGAAFLGGRLRLEDRLFEDSFGPIVPSDINPCQELEQCTGPLL